MLAGSLLEHGNLLLALLNLLALASSQLGKRIRHGRESILNASHFIPALGKPHGALYARQSFGSILGFPKLPFHALQLVRTLAEARLLVFSAPHLLLCVIKALPLRPNSSNCDGGEQVRSNLFQIESARKLAANLLGDILGAVWRQIDEVPQAQEKTVMVLRRGKNWRTGVFGAAAPTHIPPLALGAPSFSPERKLSDHRRFPVCPPTLPIQPLDRTANA
ncbi:MAG: hypothetical protein OXE48_01710 [Gammaproteobacteria bacterium]|nr:hypothetical protein [Gammaproteobacteria bacterium]MCY4340080.1 hypothetical protein [Gammaproteobacteria bacterium]